MNKETCPICKQRYTITFKTPYKTCTISSDEVDMMLDEVLEELVVPAVEGVGYVIKPGYVEVFYLEK